MDNQTQRRLYKYRVFNSRTLSMLVEDQLYFADPSSFNDPLDTRPTLEADVDEAALKEILSKLHERRVSAEMSVAARKLQTKKPRTQEYVERLGSQQANRRIENIEYNATNPDAHPEYMNRELRAGIEDELVRRYDSGIVSLSEQDDCPVLWSHYGDQHRGICIGYSVHDKGPRKPEKVEYGGSRLIQASEVASMLQDDENARKRVDAAVLFRKGDGWRYEREWRLIGDQGLQDSSLELEEIIFGCRFDPILALVLWKTFASRQRPVEFHRMSTEPGKFGLKKHPVKPSYLEFIDFPRRAALVFELFEDLSG